MFPLIKGFKATRIRNAFILNAMVAAFTAVLAIELTQQIELTKSNFYIFVNEILPGKKIGEHMKVFIVFLTTLISSIIVYHILHMLFGFGAAMIIDDKFRTSLPKY